MSPTRFLFFWLALILAASAPPVTAGTLAETPPPTITPSATPSPTATPTPSPTATLTPSPTATPTPSPTAAEAPPPSPSPSVTEPPTAPTATPSGGLGVPFLPSLPQPVPLLLGLGCGVVLLVMLGLLVALFLRRRPLKPKRPTAPLPQPPPSPPRLEARIAGRPRLFPLQKEAVTIGRAPDNDLVVSPEFPGWETVSRHHARIYRWNNRWVVEDLHSTNGIYVNGKRTGRNLLREGWRLEIGGVAFIFHEGRGGAA